MSKRAEERALEAYPRDDDKELNFRRANYRIAYERGYEQAKEDLASMAQFSSGPDGFYYGKGYNQAEKDLSLTIEDIELLHTFLYAVKNNKQGMFTFTRLSDEQYKEALRRFKAIKEEQK